MVAKVPEGLWQVSDIVEVREFGSVANKLPRPRASFERALHFRTTPFASVGDNLNAVGEYDRRNFRYRHLVFAIRADFHSRHYGACQLGAHDVSFRRNECWGEQTKVHPGSGACRSEKQELKLARSLCDSGSITNYRAPIIRKSRGKNERTFTV
jgi:hypothetical protein